MSMNLRADAVKRVLVSKPGKKKKYRMVEEEIHFIQTPTDITFKALEPGQDAMKVYSEWVLKEHGSSDMEWAEEHLQGLKRSIAQYEADGYKIEFYTI